jgi:hypothetical protein
MSAERSAHEAALLAWLQRQREVLDPTAVVVIRDRQGRVVVELPPKSREFDDLTDDDEG